MKKIFMTALVALTALTVTTALTSCSDSDNNSALVVNAGETSVSINRLGGSIEIPVKADGQWTAEVEEPTDGDVPFAECLVASGNGDYTLLLNVDYFNPLEQKQERTAKLIVRSGDKTQTINIRQYIGLKDGETAPNAETNPNSNTSPYYDLWFNKGLGAGVDPLTGNLTSPVVNIFGIKKAMADGAEEYGMLLRQTPHTNAANEVLRLDTLEQGEVGLEAHASISVSYLKFKLQINVDYKNTGKQLVNVKNYQAVQKLVFLDSYLDNMTISNQLFDDPKCNSGVTKNMFTVGFRGWYKRITQTTDKAERLEYIKKLIQGYGPAYVVGAQLGGDLFCAMRYDSIMAVDSFSVGGKLAVELALGPVQIGADVSVDYMRNATNLWSSSHHYARCSGGDQKAITELAAIVNQIEPNPALVRQLGETWAHSIVSSNDDNDNTALVSISYVPIWDLFPSDISNEIKAYVKEYYKGKTLGIDLSLLGLDMN